MLTGKHTFCSQSFQKGWRSKVEVIEVFLAKMTEKLPLRIHYFTGQLDLFISGYYCNIWPVDLCNDNSGIKRILTKEAKKKPHASTEIKFISLNFLTENERILWGKVFFATIGQLLVKQVHQASR